MANAVSNLQANFAPSWLQIFAQIVYTFLSSNKQNVVISEQIVGHIYIQIVYRHSEHEVVNKKTLSITVLYKNQSYAGRDTAPALYHIAVANYSAVLFL